MVKDSTGLQMPHSDYDVFIGRGNTINSEDFFKWHLIHAYK
jgi:hypothetical protein